jgi:serine/threonine protein kinase
MSNVVRGSLAWMAPEYLRGEKYSRKGDIYSLGASLVEMAVGGDPWRGRFASPIEAML